MVALAADAARNSRNLGVKRQYLMAASTTIYRGSLVMINSSGLAVPAAAAASNLGCVGVATSGVVSASSGDYFVEVQEGEFEFAGDSLGQDDVNKIVYADDDNTVDETGATNAPAAGVLTQYSSATSGWVLVSAMVTAGEAPAS